MIALILASFLPMGAECAWPQSFPLVQEQQADSNSDRASEQSNSDKTQEAENNGGEGFVAWMNANNGFVSGVLAFLVMAFTGVLAIVARHQHRDARIVNRAHLAIAPLGIEHLATAAPLTIEVRNVGHLPAKDVTWFIHHKVNPDGQDKDFPIDESRFYGDRFVIHPGNSMKRSHNCNVGEEAAQKLRGDKQRWFFYPYDATVLLTSKSRRCR
jgi:hypothetical protein